jgi:hypothetical protein
MNDKIFFQITASTAQILAFTVMGWLFPKTALAAFTVTGFPFGNENTAISGYQIEDFEDVNLINGLMIKFSGGITPRSYTGQLNQVFTPSTASGAGILGGPFINNTWDGQRALTNGGHGTGTTGQSPGNGNFWDFNFAFLTEFVFAYPVQSFGIGLSNFQSASKPSTDRFPPLTDHELLINGSTWGLVESIPGWISGGDVRNLYLLISATELNSINSISFRNISQQDGLVFDKLAIQSQATPEPTSIPEPSSVLSLLGMSLLGFGAFCKRKLNQK